MITSKLSLLLAALIGATDGATLDFLFSPGHLDDIAESKSTGRQAFGNDCLRGRFSYFNTADNTASLSVGVFDGDGNIVEFDDIVVNHPDGEGGRANSKIPFNSGSYEVNSNGRGTIFVSLGDPGGPYYDPPAELEFVVTSTGDECEITAMDSFSIANTGLAQQLVAPHWSKIADE